MPMVLPVLEFLPYTVVTFKLSLLRRKRKSLFTRAWVNMTHSISYGYEADLTPTANLTQAFRQVDSRLGNLVATMKSAGTFDSTLLIVYAKHGQSPINSTLLRRIPEPTLLSVVGVPTVQDASDDGSYIWLKVNTSCSLYESQ
jgi:hypothetical protein